jgi:4'-phosphopantetheinyl transferase
MAIYWLEQNEADVPAGNQWLSAEETLRLNSLRFPKRRTDWRLGRWTAKHAVAACLNLPRDPYALANIEIRAASSGAPEASSPGQPTPVTISLSHRAGTALCAVAPRGISLGCDLEVIEPRSDAFVADYFTEREHALIEQTSVEARPLLLALLWSAKESALKALRVGLRFDTRCMDVMPVNVSPRDDEERPKPLSSAPPLPDEPNGWHPVRVISSEAQVFRGWWRRADHMVRSIVSAHVPEPQPTCSIK